MGWSRQVKGLLIDLEGTVKFGGVPIPGAAEAINRLRDAGLAIRFLTNIDSLRAEQILEGLVEIGARAWASEIFSPVAALRRFVKDHSEASWLFLLSSDVLPEFQPLELPGAGTDGVIPDFVVMGDFRDRLSYDLLNRAFRCLMAGSRLVALQRQKYFLGPDGLYLDNGAFITGLEWAAGVEALILGKPSREFYTLALEDLGLLAEEVLVVGDDVNIDVAGARAVGARVALVQTGKFSLEDLHGAKAKPDLVVSSLAAIPEVLGL